MKYLLIPFLVFVLFSSSTFRNSTSQKANTKNSISKLESIHPSNIKLSGYAGEKIDLCISERIKKQDVEHLIEPFRHKNETWAWQSEFWGKWILSAIAAYKYNEDPELRKIIDKAVVDLIATQLPNGYIGNYGPEHQLTAWDIWGRKYSMLGLIRYYEISNDKKALKSAQKVADHLLTQIGPGKTDIVMTGNYHGMASSSVLEPIMYLYNHTKEQRYIDFANYTVDRWENAEGGPKLIAKALEGEWVSERFPPPPKWWSWENGQKAYEMMSCYEGLLQLYLVTGKQTYLKAVIDVVENIIDTEINIAGSGSAFECWYKGIENQTRPTYHTMETCVTMTWMKLCNTLLQVTGDSKYADQIELTFYNALMASMKFDAEEIAKYSPLEGRRHAGEEQCGMHINCCNANGPRGFTLMPTFAYMKSENSVFVNFYCESEAKIELDKNEIQIVQRTIYPETEAIELVINPKKETEFELLLRIPDWSKKTQLSINGNIFENIETGTYHSIKRLWKKGDNIKLKLDMRARIVQQNNFQAIKRGPIVLARDTRFDQGFVDETAVVKHEKGFVQLTRTGEKPENVWMAFSVPLFLGTDLEGEFKKPQQITFCDFASAGNTWEQSSRYRVWIPKTLNVMEMDYEKY